MTTPRGKLITFEGVDGAGKSTQAAALVARLKRRGLDVIATREPGGVPVGEAVRRILLEQPQGLSDVGELLLFFAVRAEHVRSVIEPALAAGRWVVCDRFADASYAYQGGGRGIPHARIDTLVEWTLRGLAPDLTLLLDLPPERIHDRLGGRDPDNFEAEEKAFFHRVRGVYLERAARDPARFEIIDAALQEERVARRVAAAVARRWPKIGLQDDDAEAGDE